MAPASCLSAASSKHAKSPRSQTLGKLGVDGREVRGLAVQGRCPPTHPNLWEVTFAESNSLLKIRIYNESPGGIKLLARTATGLHYRSRLKILSEKYMEISQKKNQRPIFSIKKKKRENILCSKRMWWKQAQKESAQISAFLSFLPLKEQK